jgi:hypothetical protein
LPLVPLVELPVVPLELPVVPPVEAPEVPPVELPVVPAVGAPLAPPFELPDVPPVGFPVVPPSLPRPPAPGVPLPSEAQAGIRKARQIPEIERWAHVLVNMIAIAPCSSELSYGMMKNDGSLTELPCWMDEQPQ